MKNDLIFKNILKWIFSIKNECQYKVLTLLGLRFKFYNEKLAMRVLNTNEQISHNLSVFALHQKVFPKYKNINFGKDVVLIATGQSLQNFSPIENAVYVGVNRAFQYDKVKFDYLFIQDYSGATKTYFDDFLSYKYARKFCGIMSEEIWPNSVIPEGKCVDVERYYVDAGFNRRRFTRDISSEAFGDSYSIVFPAMQFILWTNPKRIYIVGCDCNSAGHFNKQNNVLNTDKVVNGWKSMKDFAKIHYPDTEIISVNPIGLKGLFSEVFTNPECN